MITHHNYEKYLRHDANDELNAQAHAELETFLIVNPQLREVAEFWQSLRLPPDESKPDPKTDLKFGYDWDLNEAALLELHPDKILGIPDKKPKFKSGAGTNMVFPANPRP